MYSTCVLTGAYLRPWMTAGIIIRYKSVWVWMFRCVGEWVVSMCSGEAPVDQLVLCSSLYALWWSGAWASGRALVLQRRPMDCLDVVQGHISSLFKKEESACIWTPTESISWVCCKTTLTKMRSQLAPKFSALKWSSAVWRENSGWRGCLPGEGCV